MKRCVQSLVLLAVLWAWPLPAAETNSSNASLHTLWRAEGRSNVVYLLGSIHLLKANDYPLPHVIENAYTHSGIVAFETDIEQMQKPETQIRMMAKASLPEGETLKTQLSPKTYAAFQKELERLGLPSTMFDTLKPSIAAMAVVMVDLQKLGVDPEYGVDQHFSRRAREDGKQVVAMETLDFQINLVTDFTKAEGEDLMKTFLEQINQTRDMYADMVTSWKTGNAKGLEKLLNDGMKDSPALAKKFLFDRNLQWVPKIERMLEGRTNAIVIVGAGHLVGSGGVIELLEKKGIKLDQL